MNTLLKQFNNSTKNQYRLIINQIKLNNKTSSIIHNKHKHHHQSLSSLFNNIQSYSLINNNNNNVNTNNILYINKSLKRYFNKINHNNTSGESTKNNNNNSSVNHFDFKYKSWNNEQKEKYFKSSKTSNIVYILIAINTAAFLYINSNQDYSFQKSIDNNFLLSLDNFEKQPYTLITSFFAHQSFSHFLFNMVGLFTIGPMVLSTLGASSFFGLYMASGVVSGLSFLALQKYYRNDAQSFRSGFSFFNNNAANNQYQYSMRRSHQRALGASGAIYGVMAVFGCLYPNAILNIYGIIPIPAMLAVGGFIAYDLFQEVSQANSGVSHIGHLGGAAYGLLYYLFKLRGRYRSN